MYDLNAVTCTATRKDDSLNKDHLEHRTLSNHKMKVQIFAGAIFLSLIGTVVLLVTMIRTLTMILDTLYYEFVAYISQPVLTTAVLTLTLLGCLTFKSVSSDKVLPGVPQLKGVPILGALPIYLKYGMPHLLGKLIAIGQDGISYANIANNVLVSVHDPAMVREVLAYPEDIASR